MKTKVMILAVGGALMTPVGADGQESEANRSALGSTVQLHPREGGRTSGELLSISPDSLWLRSGNVVRAEALDRLERVVINHGNPGANAAWGWSILAGALSGALLTAACSSVADADCGGVFLGTMSLWVLAGAASASSMQGTRYERVYAPYMPDRWRELRPHARFPQGMPAGFESDTLPAAAPLR